MLVAEHPNRVKTAFFKSNFVFQIWYQGLYLISGSFASLSLFYHLHNFLQAHVTAKIRNAIAYNEKIFFSVEGMKIWKTEKLQGYCYVYSMSSQKLLRAVYRFSTSLRKHNTYIDSASRVKKPKSLINLPLITSANIIQSSSLNFKWISLIDTHSIWFYFCLFLVPIQAATVTLRWKKKSTFNLMNGDAVDDGCTNNLGHLSTDNNLNNTKISNFFDFRIELKLCVQSMKGGMWEMCRDNSFI